MPVDFSLAHIERRLAAAPRTDPETRSVRTAVAALLRYRDELPEVLLMKRAERADDRWSGHISLPGGREAPDDEDLRATAVRETREEVGLDLDRDARLIGRLGPVRAVAKGNIIPMVVAPFVFVQTRAAPVVLGHEAQDSFWLPLERAASGELDGEHPYKLGPLTKRFPCWRYDGHVVWGLTYRMLVDLLRLAGAG
ncbi:NUDIX hydrolase [Haliangium sp.]|uniref:NUDIX hydrolase n=1 Tax=Haliangium sp. TaxID=2663208 RepID=UPI003D0FB74A